MSYYFHAFDAWAGFWGNLSPYLVVMIFAAAFAVGFFCAKQRSRRRTRRTCTSALAAATLVVWILSMAEMRDGAVQFMRNVFDGVLLPVVATYAAFVAAGAGLLVVATLMLCSGDWVGRVWRRVEDAKSAAKAIRLRAVASMTDQAGIFLGVMPFVVERRPNGEEIQYLTRESMEAIRSVLRAQQRSSL